MTDGISGVFAAELGRNNTERRFQRQIVFIHKGAVDRRNTADFEPDYIFFVQSVPFFQYHSVQADFLKNLDPEGMVQIKFLTFHRHCSC